MVQDAIITDIYAAIMQSSKSSAFLWRGGSGFDMVHYKKNKSKTKTDIGFFFKELFLIT